MSWRTHVPFQAWIVPNTIALDSRTMKIVYAKAARNGTQRATLDALRIATKNRIESY